MLVSDNLYRLRISDIGASGCLGFDLKDILRAIGPKTRSTFWTVSGVNDEPVWATGRGGAALEELQQFTDRINGTNLSKIAGAVCQTIWARFDGYDDQRAPEPWVTVLAIDSSWFEVQSADKKIIERVRAAFQKTILISQPTS